MQRDGQMNGIVSRSAHFVFFFLIFFAFITFVCARVCVHLLYSRDCVRGHISVFCVSDRVYLITFVQMCVCLRSGPTKAQPVSVGRAGAHAA